MMNENKKYINELFQLANDLCPYKGEDDVYSHFNALEKVTPISIKRSCWINGFIKATLILRKIENTSK